MPKGKGTYGHKAGRPSNGMPMKSGMPMRTMMQSKSMHSKEMTSHMKGMSKKA